MPEPRAVSLQIAVVAGILAISGAARAQAAKLEPHTAVTGSAIDAVELVGPTGAVKSVDWSTLGQTTLAPGQYVLRAAMAGGEGLHVEVPPCAGRTSVRLDGSRIGQGSGPVVAALPPRPAQAHSLEIEIKVGTYERRIACGFAPRYGAKVETKEGLGTFTFASPASTKGGGQAVVFVPKGLAPGKPAPLLVGAHPWNGAIYTYPAYAELLEAAQKHGVVLLFPSGLGNSLYTADAEDEVMRAIDALAATMPIDARRVSIWGASMGGAGATTIAFHRPDRFAFVASLFGDSKYDLATYVKSVLGDEAGAHRVNALDVVDNARHLDLWLIHGEADKISPIAQSTMLADAMKERGFTVRFDRVPRAGHDGALVAKNAAAIVERAALARRVEAPTRITYKSVRPNDVAAYGVRITRSGKDDAFIDIERVGDKIVVHKAVNVRAIEIGKGTFGSTKSARIERAESVPAAVEVKFEDSGTGTPPGTTP